MYSGKCATIYTMNFWKNRKFLIILFTFFILGIFVFFAGRIAFVYIHSISAPFVPKKVHTVLQPPKDALTAQITNILGGVKKEGRQDTDFKEIQTAPTLVEGESLATDATGSATITIPEIISIKLFLDKPDNFKGCDLDL